MYNNCCSGNNLSNTNLETYYEDLKSVADNIDGILSNQLPTPIVADQFVVANSEGTGYTSKEYSITTELVSPTDNDEIKILPDWLKEFLAYPKQDHIVDGYFRYWPKGESRSIKSIHNLLNVNSFAIRNGYNEGCSAYKLPIKGIRLQRNAEDVLENTLHYTILIDRNNIEKLKGSVVTLQAILKKSEDWTGSDVSIKTIYSSETIQPLRSDDGMFISENVVLDELIITPTTSFSTLANAHFSTFTIPEDITQLAICVSVPWSGEAPIKDYIDIQQINLAKTDKIFHPISLSESALVSASKRNYQSSYPSLHPPGAICSLGALNKIVVSENTTYATIFDIEFDYGFQYTPTLWVYAPSDGQDYRFYSRIQDTTLDALAFDLSNKGATVTNAVGTYLDDVISIHYAAEAIGV